MEDKESDSGRSHIANYHRLKCYMKKTTIALYSTIYSTYIQTQMTLQLSPRARYKPLNLHRIKKQMEERVQSASGQH